MTASRQCEGVAEGRSRLGPGTGAGAFSFDRGHKVASRQTLERTARDWGRGRHEMNRRRGNCDTAQIGTVGAPEGGVGRGSCLSHDSASAR
jgi:hypothetical protein